MKRFISVFLSLIMTATAVNPMYVYANEPAVFVEVPTEEEETAEDCATTISQDGIYAESVCENALMEGADICFDDSVFSDGENLDEADDSEECIFFSEESDFTEQSAGFADKEYIVEKEEKHVKVDSDSFPSDDELFSGYVNSVLQIEDIETEQIPSAGKASDTLSGLDAIVYTKMKSMISEVASGKRSSTVFEISLEELGFAGKTWNAQELGVDSLFLGNSIAPDAALALWKIIEVDYTVIFGSLLYESPYDLYWFDKTQGYSLREPGIGCMYDGREYVLYFTGGLTWSWPVAEEYAAGVYAIDTSIGQAVTDACDNAHAIVAANAGKSDYQKLLAYKKEICKRVSYNDNAVNVDIPYGNPWQLIWVFDNDSNTNVVCEGYSKAFQYLCDLSTFSNNIECRIITGDMNGGGHMWNAVTMEDGKNYHVDVTNCDEGTIGEDSLLFLVGYTSGNLSNGYVYKCWGYEIHYTFDDSLFYIFSEEELTMSATSYEVKNEEPEPENPTPEEPEPENPTPEEPEPDNPTPEEPEPENPTPENPEPEEPAVCEHTEVILESVEPGCTEDGKTEGSQCSLCGEIIVEQDVIPALGHSFTYYESDHNAICEDDGTMTAECDRCEEKNTIVDKGSAPGHKWGTWKTVTAATVFRTGVKMHACAVCGAEDKAAIAKLVPAIKVTSTSFKMKTKQVLTTFKVSMRSGDYVKSFKSNRNNVVTVSKWNKNGTCTLTAKAAGTARLTIILASGKYAYVTVSVTSKDVATTMISGVKTAAAVAVGKYITLAPIRSPFNSSQKVTYKTSNANIVKVSSAGKILGVAPGKAIITVTSGSKSARCIVTVLGIRVSAKAIVEKGKLAKIQPVKYGISNAFTFTSSNTSIVRVAQNGTIKGMAPGVAKITITAGAYKAACIVTVPGIRGVSSKVTIARGKTLRISPLKYGISSGFKFQSSNTSVASVSAKGIVAAKKKGTAIITVSCGKYAVKCKVTVK